RARHMPIRLISLADDGLRGGDKFEIFLRDRFAFAHLRIAVPMASVRIGEPGHIVSPLWVEVVIQDDGRKQAEFEGRAWMKSFDDLPGSLKFLVGVGPGEIEVELVGVDFGQEVSATMEGFQIEEFVFFETVDGFDVALESVSGRRNTDMLAVAESGRKIPFELAAVVGLPGQIAQRDAVAMQMLLDARGEDGAGGSRTLFSEGPEQQAAAHITGGVLNRGQAQGLSLGPV